MTEQEITRAILQAIELNKTISYVDDWGKKRKIKLVDLFDYVAKISKEIALEMFSKMLKARVGDYTDFTGLECDAVSVETIDETLKEMGVEE